MKVIHLISGGDSGGAKTHVLSLLQNLSRTIEVDMVCFMEGPFAQEARELGISTQVYSDRNVLRTLRLLKQKIREGGYDLIHCHGGCFHISIAQNGWKSLLCVALLRKRMYNEGG